MWGKSNTHGLYWKTVLRGNNMDKKVLKAKNAFIILALVYTLITILAVISLISEQSTIQTVTGIKRLGAIFKEIWWPLLIICIFVITYMLYNNKQIKKIKLAGFLEFVTGVSMLINTVINMISIGNFEFTIIFSFIFPTLLMLFSVPIINMKIADNENTENTLNRKKERKI